MRQLLWEMEAWGEYEEIQSDKKKLKKVNNLLKDIVRRHPRLSYPHTKKKSPGRLSPG